MPNNWYYEHDGAKTGPWTDGQLKDLARSGLISATDTIWKEGFERGVPASRIKNLFADESELAQPANPSPSDAAAAEFSPADSSQASRTPVPAPASNPEVAILAETAEPQAHEKPEPTPYQPSMPWKPEKKVDKRGRATAVKGMVIISQDGETVRYRKKCVKCGYVDVCANRLTMKSGVIRSTFFCPKCRKAGEVIVQCNT